LHPSRNLAALTAQQVLVVAQDAEPVASVCAELVRRGGVIGRAASVPESLRLARSQSFDLILILVDRESAGLMLLAPLLRNEALGQPRIIILVDPAEAETVSRAAPPVDALLSAEMDPSAIADAVGLTNAEPTFLPPAVVQPKTTSILVLPAPLAASQLPDDVAQCTARGARPDAVLLTDATQRHLMTAWMSAAAAAVVPVIDASGGNLPGADAVAERLSPAAIRQALAETRAVRERIRALPDAFFRTTDPRAQLLARLAVRERDCEPQRDVSRASTFAFPDELAIPGLAGAAEMLARTGHLQRRFFDRLQCCPNCTSARVLVREECSKCRSGDIDDEPIIHHLRCGYQGPERDFRKANRLTCPKCRQHLEHFSVDYDKPGRLFICNDCGQTTASTAVGFACMDCDTRHDTNAMQARTVYSYALTETGRDAAFAPPPEPVAGTGREVSPIRATLRDFIAAQNAAGTPHAALFIRLDPTGEAEASLGAKPWLETRKLFATILREVFCDAAEIVDSGNAFLVLLPDTKAEAIALNLPRIRQELEKTLRHPTGAIYDVLPADVLARFG
jgi:DNA-binding NarL/FixJ family response regulator